MWRPFACNFVVSDYSNFRREVLKSPFLPTPQTTKHFDKIDLENLFPFRQRRERLKLRQEKLHSLKQHVREQREEIRERERNLQFAKIEQSQARLDMKEQLRQKKQQELSKLRSLSSAKVRRVRFEPSHLTVVLQRLRSKSVEPLTFLHRQPTIQEVSVLFPTQPIESEIGASRSTGLAKFPSIGGSIRKGVTFDEAL